MLLALGHWGPSAFGQSLDGLANAALNLDRGNYFFFFFADFFAAFFGAAFFAAFFFATVVTPKS